MSDRPDPILKASKATELPREARARIGLTTDPVPEGKKLDAAPKLSSPIEPAKRDGDDKVPEDLTSEEKAAFEEEIKHAHAHGNRFGKGGGGAGLPPGQPSGLLKQPDSRHHGASSHAQ